MSPHLEFINLAREFWQQAGGALKPPYDIERACPRVLPLAIVQLANTTHQSIVDWLQRMGVEMPSPVASRRLRGCVVAYRGRGFLFVDYLDSPEERRITIAHEVGHFLVDYASPRNRAMDRLGASSLEILDGLRQPTLDERAYAVLSGISMLVYYHTSGREGLWGCPYLGGNSEAQADQLALELLAPELEVYRRVEHGRGRKFSHIESDIRNTLGDEFELPPSIVSVYAHRLAFSWTGGPSVREWFGLI